MSGTYYFYKEVPFSQLRKRDDQLDIRKLNDYGKHGWELVHVDKVKGQCVFKMLVNRQTKTK